jgi:hypothetical protein
LPPITNVCVKRPFFPVSLREQWKYEGRPTVAEAARMIACWQQQLRINAELNLGALVVEETPFHSDQ